MEIVLQTNESNVFRGFVTNEKSLNERGILVNSPSRSVTNPIEVEERKAVVFSHAVNYAFYGDNGFIEYGESGNPINFAFVPAGAKYIRVTILNQDVRLFILYQVKRTSGIYKDDAALEYAKEPGHQFLRCKFNQKITFLLDDYDYIMEKPFETKFRIAFIDNNEIIYQGTFHRTDCDINEDDKKLSVQPITDDGYVDLLSGYDREFDLIKLNPVTQEVVIHKRPLIQYYALGDSRITCVGADTYWQQECTEVGDAGTLMSTYFFGLNTSFREISIRGAMIIPNVSGEYIGEFKPGVATEYWREDQEYYIKSVVIVDSQGRPRNMLQIFGKDGIPYFTSVEDGTDPNGSKTFIPTPGNPPEAYGTAYMYGVPHDVYSRLLLDVDQYGSKATYQIPFNDMAGDNRNYRKCIGLSYSTLSYSDNFSSSPTKWGRTDDGRYFDVPYHIGYEQYYPIAQGTWGYYSLWFGRSRFDWVSEELGVKSFRMNDAIPIWSAIKVLLGKIAPGLKHEGTEEYSEFLYGRYNPLSRDEWRLYITPKSNIRNGEYQTPAQKAPITLQSVMMMLANVFRCYCYVDGDKFKIEHIEFFRNGGHYYNSAAVGMDLTKAENVRNGKKWAFATSKYNFEKINMPERYEFKWMDDCTDFFDGEPIIIKNEFVEKGKKEELNIGNYTSDIDYILMNPSSIAQDGFVLFAAEPGEAITDNMEYYGYVETSGTDKETSPRININPLFGSREASLELILEGGGNGKIMFYDGEGKIISQQSVVQSAPTRQTIPVNIPSGAEQFAFKATGKVVAKVYSISVDSYPQIPIVREMKLGMEYRLQNGYLSLYDVQPKYWVYDMPSYAININGIDTQARTVQRLKVQEINFPYSININTAELVKTNLGIGQIEKLSVNLNSNFAKSTLKYDTY